MKKNISVALIGRPNVGKSTLCNRLAGKSFAIVDDSPGTTRDRREIEASIGPYEFSVIDTAGIEEAETNSLSAIMFNQTVKAIEDCDVIFFIIDGLSSLNSKDIVLSNWARKFSKPTFLILNKCENSSKTDDAYNDSFMLGLGEPICISAEHKLGFNDILEVLLPFIEKHKKSYDNYICDNNNQLIQLSIIGRPNVGKSTLVNSLLAEEKLVTSDVAGTTRDAVAFDWKYQNYKIKLVDTAGIRKRTKITDKVEQLSVKSAKYAINFSHVVIMLIDAKDLMNQQDLSIIEYAVNEGRGVVIAINKWDIETNKAKKKKDILYQIDQSLRVISGVEVIFVSAKKATNLNKLMDAVINVFDNWNKRISTSILNTWIISATKDHPIPLNAKKKRPKIKFVTQYKTRPPTFMLHSNFPKDISISYQRYLIGSIRQYFNLQGTPIRLNFKSGQNPYKGHN